MAEHEERATVLKNFTSLSVLQAITYLLPVLILPYLFRVIGPAKFGLIAFAQAMVQYFMILTDYGFSISATREISLHQDKHERVSEIFSSVMVVKIGLAFLSLLILGALVYFIPRFRADWQVYIFSWGMVAGNTLFPMWFFQGKEKMKYIADLNIAGGILTVILILFCVRQPENYLRVPLIFSLVSIVTGIAGQYIALRKFGVSFRFPGYTGLREQLTAGWDIFVSIAAINTYTTTRVFTVGLLTNNTITGFYSAAERIANLCQTFPLTSFSQALFPRLSRIYHKNKARAFEFMKKIQQITILLSFITLPVIFIFARPIMNLICGGQYPIAVLSLRLLLVPVFFVSVNAFRVQFLLVCGKPHIYARIHVMMAMVGLPLIFLLTYSFSSLGAAVSAIVIEAGIFVITYITVNRLKFE